MTGDRVGGPGRGPRPTLSIGRDGRGRRRIGQWRIRGDSAGGAADQAGDALGDLVCDRDTLSVGPLVPGEDLSSLLRRRAAWWNGWLAEQGEIADGPVEDDGFPVDTEAAYRRFDGFASEAAARAERVRLWCGVGLNDWLFVACWATLLRRGGWTEAPLEVICFERIEWGSGRGYTPLTLGEVAPDDYRRPPPAVALTPDRAEELAAAWDAVSGTDPAALTEFLGRSTPHLPRLAAAVRRLLFHYPSAETGLPYWEEEMLRGLTGGEVSVPHLIGNCLTGRSDVGDDVGDGTLWDRLRELAASPNPLVALKKTGPIGMGFDARLTAAGRSVLEGEAHALNLRPIDRWIGGVRLSTAADNIWVRDVETLIRRPCR